MRSPPTPHPLLCWHCTSLCPLPLCDAAAPLQTEKAFQKQDAVFVGRHKGLLTKKKVGTARFVRSVGLGFKTPKAAVEGTYIDKKCPFTGGVSIRGRILKGVVISTKMARTVVIRRDYLRFVRKYRR
jgi:small subunit ribosomal protein S11e